MLSPRLLSVSLLLLTACTGPQSGYTPANWPWPFVSGQNKGPAAHPHAAHSNRPREFNFDWQLSGDPEIMPVQVFDDGMAMWLQFAPEGVWPAVFEVRNGGWQPLPYRRDPPYMLLDGVYEHLELRGGHLRGSIRRPNGTFATQAPPTPPSPLPATTAVELRPLAVNSKLDAMPVPGTGTTVIPAAAPSPAPALPREYSGAESHAVSFLGTPVPRYSVSTADQTIRQALERWAREAGWTFSSEHWAVDVDIPLVGQASFDTDFKAAVRELLVATEMGDRPLQPCFYSNRVLRVVPYAQPCDRSAGTRALS